MNADARLPACDHAAGVAPWRAARYTARVRNAARIFLVVLLSAPVVDAATSGPVAVHDGEEYEASLPARTRACIVFPASMFDATHCPAGAKPTESVPGSGKTRVVALGLLTVDDRGKQRQAQFMIAFNPLTYSSQPDRAVADAYAAGMMDRIPSQVPGGKVRTESRAVRLVTRPGETLVRIAYDVDGATGAYERFQHSISYSGWSQRGSYAFTITTAAANAAVFEAVADEIAQTIRLVHPAPLQPR